MTDLHSDRGSDLGGALELNRDRLEPATIYGIPSLRWPGANAHDYFAAVKSGKSYVSLYLLVADTFPEALEGASPELLKRCQARQPSTSRDWMTTWPATLKKLYRPAIRALRDDAPRRLMRSPGYEPDFDTPPLVTRKRHRHAPRGLEAVRAALGNHRFERDAGRRRSSSGR